MKIEIDIIDTNRATITIDGQALEVNREGSTSKISGLDFRRDYSLLAAIASKLHSTTGCIMDAIVVADPTQPWKQLDEDTYELVEDAML